MNNRLNVDIYCTYIPIMNNRLNVDIYCTYIPTCPGAGALSLQGFVQNTNIFLWLYSTVATCP
jgi:hypothetical protein